MYNFTFNLPFPLKICLYTSRSILFPFSIIQSVGGSNMRLVAIAGDMSMMCGVWCVVCGACVAMMYEVGGADRSNTCLLSLF